MAEKKNKNGKKGGKKGLYFDWKLDKNYKGQRFEIIRAQSLSLEEKSVGKILYYVQQFPRKKILNLTTRKFRKFSQIFCQKIYKSYNFAFTTISCHHILEYSISFPIKKTETNSNGNFLRSFHFNTEKMKKKVFEKINVKVFSF